MTDFAKANFFAFRFFNGCPVGCPHCSADAPTSLPIRNGITVEDVLVGADLFVNLGGPRHAFFMGHELSIGDDEFCQLAAELTIGRGFTLSAATSGYWARTPPSLLEGVQYLLACGVNHIQLSVDHFHRNVICDNGVRALIEKCNQKGIAVTLYEALLPQLESRSLLFSKLPGVVALHQSAVSLIGRASALRLKKETTSENVCDFGKVLYLETDNNLYACSGPGNKVPSRSVGSVHAGVGTYHTPHMFIAETVVTARNGDNTCNSCHKYFTGTLNKPNFAIPAGAGIQYYHYAEPLVADSFVGHLDTSQY